MSFMWLKRLHMLVLLVLAGYDMAAEMVKSILSEDNKLLICGK